MLKIIGLKKVTYYRWLKRGGQPNRHNGKIPKSHWLTPEDYLLGRKNDKLKLREAKLEKAEQDRLNYWKEKNIAA